MADIKLNGAAIRFITLFEGTTGARVKDFIDHGDKIIYVVEKGHIRRALGRNSQNIRLLKDKTGKNIDVIEYSEKPEKFIKNIFHNFKIDEIKFEDRNGKRTAIVSVAPTQKVKAIGRGGRNLNLAREIIKRHDVDVEDIVIS